MIADGRLLDIIRRAHTFGLTLLKMDVRQESGRHADVLAAICAALDAGDYAAWSEEQKCKWLVRRRGLLCVFVLCRTILCGVLVLPYMCQFCILLHSNRK